MNQYRLVTKAGLLASSAVAAFAFSAPAFAQDAQEAPSMGESTMENQAADDAAAQDAPAGDEIVVTGTLIRNPNLESSTPVNVTTSDAIELKQANVAEEILRELPGVVPAMGSAVNNGANGANTVDLRGLGPNRNLVLLDGNRLVPFNLTGVVDLNNIPLALIDRVDALTGAAVTTYGADAITGVVNFITRRDFAGVEVSGSEQITELGDGNFMRADLTMGANFDDGRGNAVLSLGYQESDPVYQGDRDFSVFQVSSYSGGESGSGTAVPSRFGGLRNITANCAVIGDIPDNPATPNVDERLANRGTSQINWGSRPCPGGANASTYAPFNFNPYNIFQTPFKRVNIYSQANYEISDAVEVYGRGLFSHNTIDTVIAPSGSFGGTVPINMNNPFLPALLRDQFCAFDVNPRADIYQPRFTPAECAAAATATGPSDPNYRVTGTGSFVPFDVNNDGVIGTHPITGAITEGYNNNPAVVFNRRTTEAGPRLQYFTTNVFDVRAGLRGPLTSTIDWDLAGSYGQSYRELTVTGYTLQSRFRSGALVNGTLQNPTCVTVTGQPACVPINIFGPEGSISDEAVDFLTEGATSVIETKLGQLRGIVSGDFGYALPWAVQPIGFALGTEFRKYKAIQRADVLAKSSGELGGAGGPTPDINGGYAVYEGYGELVAPIVEDKAFFESLTLETGVRYSLYEVDGGGSNKAWTWKAGGSWEPGYGLKIRGNYSRAVRAPNIGELFTPLSGGLTNLALDPCAGAAPLSNANLRAVCLAQGAPAGSIGLIANPTAAQANIITGGNIELDPEKANTWTLGVVFQPEFLPRFSASLDYYNIKVTDVIGAPLPGDLIDACFGNITAASATDPACTVIRRNSQTGGLDGDPALTPGLFAQTNNLGELFTDGVDLIMAYRTNVGFGDLSWSFTGNWTNHSKFQSNASDPDGLNRECAGHYSVNCSFTGSIQPKLQFSQRATLSLGKVDLSLLWRWIDKVTFEPQQLEDDWRAADAANRGANGQLLPLDLTKFNVSGYQQCPNFETTDDFACMVEEEFRSIPSEHYFDFTARFNATDNITFTATVQNLFNNQPKVVGNTIGQTTFNSGNIFPSTYDALGRRYGVSAKLKF